MTKVRRESPVARWVGTARLGARVSAFVLLSIGKYVAYEAEVARHGESYERLMAGMDRFGRTMVRLFGVEITTRGVPEGSRVPGQSADGKGRIFIMNHRSGLDILVSLAALEGRHLSRADLAKWPVIGLVARRAGTLFVDRSSRRSGARALGAMVRELESGHAVIVFPEGTTYEGDEVRPFKAGALAAARRAGAEVVPVGVAYAGGAASFGEEETFLEHMARVGSAAKTRVALVVGTPLSAEESAGAEGTERARAAVQAAVYEARALIDG